MSSYSICSICTNSISLPEGKDISSFKQTKITYAGENALRNTTDPILTKCNHAFHHSCLKNCIDAFVSTLTDASCPTCGKTLIPLTKEQINQLNGQQITQLSVEQINRILPYLTTTQLSYLTTEQLQHPQINWARI